MPIKILSIKRIVLNALSYVFSCLPDSELKQKLRCWKANLFWHLPCRMSFKNGLFYAAYPKFTLSFHSDPCSILSTNRLYLHDYRPKLGDIVIDAGAHVGGFSLFIAKQIGDSGRVIAYEADPIIFSELTANIARNGLTNVTAVHAALSDKNGMVRFQQSTTNSLSGSISGIRDGDEFIEVVACTLDSEIERLKIHSPHLIKMNIEGAELTALEGAINFLRSLEPTTVTQFAISTDHLVNGQFTYTEVEAFLAGYSLNVETTFVPYQNSIGKSAEYITTYARPTEKHVE